MGELTPHKIAELREKIEKRDSVFSEKRYLDFLHLPSKIIGREEQAERLVSIIMSLKDGFIVPLISVYGRSGSGKSTVVKFVLENLADVVSYRFVNLRKAKTVFGCANLILGELGSPNLSSAEGINKAIDCMEKNIESLVGQSGKKFFVLVLDEYDVVFSDKRGNPSDFVYKILQMEENLRERGVTLCTVTISNNALDDYSLDDRIKSRMGSSEIHFTPYSKNDVLGIIRDRAKIAFKDKPDNDVLEYCASMASADHGDARRALDLLRVAGEICDGKIKKEDIDSAQKLIQKDRADEIIQKSSYHTRCVVGAICSLCIINEESWCATSSIFKKYSDIVSKKESALRYRRISDLLVELENAGILVSRAYSRGRNGYGREYKLKVDPRIIGPAVDQKWWEGIVENKKSRDELQERINNLKSLGSPFGKNYKMFSKYGNL